MIISHAGKVAFITGAGSGIGRGIALRLASDGASIAVVDLKLELAQETLALVKAQGGAGVALAADVRSREQIQSSVNDTVTQLGSLDLLVNNAGVVTMTSLADLTDDEWDFVVDVNLKGQFIAAQIASRVMPSGGAIVNLATVESEVVVSSSGNCQPHYNASKGGVTMLTKALAVELAQKGIRVNAVAPGFCAAMNLAVAIAHVNTSSAVASNPSRQSFNATSRRVRCELFVRKRKGISSRRNRATNSSAPGISWFPR